MPSTPSITFWSRLEPRPRSNDLAGTLAARVRDPAWLLARQWQLGEYAGEDAGSPAYMQIDTDLAMLGAWAPQGAADQQLPEVSPGLPPEYAPGVPVASLRFPAHPLEGDALTEPFPLDDVATRVELGQRWERHLSFIAADSFIAAFRSTYAIPDAPPDPADDPTSARFRAMWQGRVVDGLELFIAAKASTPAYPPGAPAITPPALAAAVLGALGEFIAEVEADYGSFGASDPAAWDASRLEYRVRAFAKHPTSGNVALDGTPDSHGDLEWYAFDAVDAGAPSSPLQAPLDAPVRTIIPAPVRFRGMPNARFWDFDDGRVDFGAVTPDKKDLATLILLDFMLVHGNDWFVIPFEMPVGSLCKTTITVSDVFGNTFVVNSANSATTPRWSMFATKSGEGLADYYLLPATAASSSVDGEPVEDIRFLRDEQANLVWAVERTTESHIGLPLPGAERAPAEIPTVPTTAPLRYQIQTLVPPNWIPFQAVSLDDPLPAPQTGQIALQRSRLLDPTAETNTNWQTITPSPRSRIVGNPPTPYLVREEEVPREGTHLQRLVRLTRWIDGSTKLWVTRRRSVSTGEGSSGLAYDLALKP